ncbi:hypothetical protein CR513_41323, partial [Mucuna pruriens]
MFSRGCLLAPLVRCFGKKTCCPSFFVFCGPWFHVLVLSAMDKLKLKCKGLFCNICCLGCCKRTPRMDITSKRLRTQDQTGTKEDGSQDFWSTSTFELDHSAGHSQRSISSTGLSNNLSDPQSSGGSQSGPPEFVNHGKFAVICSLSVKNLIYAGLLLWNQIRQEWVGNKRSASLPEIQEPRISSTATYDNLLGSNKPFPQPIPL